MKLNKHIEVVEDLDSLGNIMDLPIKDYIVYYDDINIGMFRMASFEQDEDMQRKINDIVNEYLTKTEGSKMDTNTVYDINTLEEFKEYFESVPEEAFDDCTLTEMIIDAQVMGVMNPELANMLLGGG